MIKIPKDQANKYLKNHLQVGDVLLWEYFDFKRGHSKHSRFIVLTNCRSDSFLAIRPTTKIEKYNNQIFSKNKEYFLIPADQEPTIPLSSIIDLNNIHLLKFEQILEKFGAGITPLGKLGSVQLNEIRKLVEVSKVLRKDQIDWIIESLS